MLFRCRTVVVGSVLLVSVDFSRVSGSAEAPAMLPEICPRRRRDLSMLSVWTSVNDFLGAHSLPDNQPPIGSRDGGYIAFPSVRK